MVSREIWLAKKAKQKKRLYEQYGKPFEKDHHGEDLDISEDGRTILGDRLGEVLQTAVNTFGRDNLALARVGHETVEEWLTSRPL